MTEVDTSFLETEDAAASTPARIMAVGRETVPSGEPERPPQLTEPARRGLDGTDWKTRAVCHGRSGEFFAPTGERPEARQIRESIALAICETCPVMSPCRVWARANREYGFWGGESEEDRAEAGFRVQMPVGRLAHYPPGEGEGEPVQPRRPLRRGSVLGAGAQRS